MSQEAIASTSFVTTNVLDENTQATIKSNIAEYVAFGQKVDAQNLSRADKKTLSTLSAEQWTQITDKLKESPAFQAQVSAYKAGKTLEPPHAAAQAELQVVLGTIGVASSAVLGVSGAIFGIAAAAAATGVGIPLGIVAAIIGGISSVVGGVLGLVALLQPMESTLEIGGRGGSLFNDSVKEGWKIKRIIIRYGNIIDGIRCVWQRPDGSLQEGQHHGGYGGVEKIIDLRDGEYVIEVAGAAGNVVDSLRITTNYAKYGPYGGNGGKPFSLKPSSGSVIGFYGRSGNLLDAIGIQDAMFMFERKYYGGTNGIPFIEDVSEMKQMKRIILRSDAYIDTLQFEWINSSNEYITGAEYGGYGMKGGNSSFIEFQEGEYLTKITGKAGIYMDSVCFHTNLKVHGPYGGSGGSTPFIIDLTEKRLLCLIGRYGRFIDGIGVLVKSR